MYSADRTGEGPEADGGEGVRETADFFDLAEGLKKPHLKQIYSKEV